MTISFFAHPPPCVLNASTKNSLTANLRNYCYIMQEEKEQEKKFMNR